MTGFDRTLVYDVGTTIAAGRPVRRPLPGGGMIHIDRPLPFLVVHRRPARREDPGTTQLLMGEAAYLHASADEVPHALLVDLITEITDCQRRAFGAGLVLELWATAPDRPYRIVASRHRPPTTALEELENSLLAIAADAPGTVVEYQDVWAPPGLRPLLPADHGELEEVSHVGLEIPATYRAADGTVFPFELRDLRRDLGKALKRSFYAFTLSCTTRVPDHYQELGRQVMTDAVLHTDRELAAISHEFDLLLHVTPVNVPDAFDDFSSGGFRESPEFLYRPRTVDPDLMKRRLYEIPIEEIEDPTLAHIFIEKRSELDRQLTLVADRNTPRFLLESRQLHGDVTAELLATAERLVTELPPERSEDTPTLPAETFARQARAEIDRYRAIDGTLRCEVLVRTDIPGVLVSRGNLMIGASATFTPQRADGLVAHEIGVHVLTHHNGSRQSLRELHAGMAGYESLQEGLAVLSEHLVGCLDPARLRQIAGRVLAVHLVTDGADFVATFDELHRRHGFPAGTAFTTAMRIFRGGGYTKDLVYLRGLTEVLRYLADGGPLQRLFVGKVAYENLHLIEELEWRMILVPPQLLPLHFRDPVVQARVERVAAGMTVFDLAEAA